MFYKLLPYGHFIWKIYKDKVQIIKKNYYFYDYSYFFPHINPVKTGEIFIK